jgi:hypothetical protein
MDNINKILKSLAKIGFTIRHGEGSRLKILPKDKTLPFYTAHWNNTGKCYFPLVRFARKNWNIDLEKL